MECGQLDIDQKQQLQQIYNKLWDLCLNEGSSVADCRSKTLKIEVSLYDFVIAHTDVSRDIIKSLYGLTLEYISFNTLLKMYFSHNSCLFKSDTF